MQGRSLLAAIKSPAQSEKVSEPGVAAAGNDRPIYSETDYPHRAFKWSSLRSVRTGKYLAIETPKRELYDQVSDPKALNNLAPSTPAITNTLINEVEQFRQKTATDLGDAAKLDSGQAEKLAALGYVAGDSGPEHEGKIGGIDPKDRIEIANLLHDGILDVEQGEYGSAIAKLERRDPDRTRIGNCLSAIGNGMDSIEGLRQGVAYPAKSG